jgi:hypothetical protein
MPYNPALVAPMREEMVRMGAQELTTVAAVDAALGDQKGTMLVFVNSVCGCAAGNARPALRLALLRDGEVVHFVHRHMIEGRSPQLIAGELTQAFDKYFGVAV